MNLRVLIAGCLLLAGCAYRDQGHIGAVMASAPEVDILSNQPVRGRVCLGHAGEYGDMRIVEAAVHDALAQAPEADVLVDAVIEDDKKCIIVTGRPARLVTKPARE